MLENFLNLAAPHKDKQMCTRTVKIAKLCNKLSLIKIY